MDRWASGSVAGKGRDGSRSAWMERMVSDARDVSCVSEVSDCIMSCHVCQIVVRGDGQRAEDGLWEG